MIKNLLKKNQKKNKIVKNKYLLTKNLINQRHINNIEISNTLKLDFLKLYEVAKILEFKFKAYGIVMNNFEIKVINNQYILNFVFYIYTNRVLRIKKKYITYQKRRVPIWFFIKKKINKKYRKKISEKVFQKNKKRGFKLLNLLYLNKIKNVNNRVNKIKKKKFTKLFIRKFKQKLINLNFIFNHEIILNFNCLNFHFNAIKIIKSQTKKFAYQQKILFPKKSYLYFDLLKLTYLFLSKKIKPILLCQCIAKVFSRLNKRKHLKFMKFLNSYFLELTTNHSNYFKGIRIELYGRISGKSRASKYKLLVGSLNRKTLQNQIFFNKCTAKTFYGMFGFKFWFLLNENKQILTNYVHTKKNKIQKISKTNKNKYNYQKYKF